MEKQQNTWPADRHLEPKDWLDRVLTVAITHRYSDLYLKAEGDSYRLAGQAFGKFVVLSFLETTFAERVLAIVKYRAQLNLAEKRRPQLGRFTFSGHAIRVSCVGDFLGKECFVFRFIYQDDGRKQSFNQAQLKRLLSDRPAAGLYLIAGPTGAGKTSTLYRLLKEWSSGQVVLTVEDPVEYYVPEYLQLQVNEQAGIYYEDLIKVALRQRPDILVVGEIRDGKTAKAALQAALSGHLVLSTIHANSARLVPDRLVNLGLNRSLVMAALEKTVYQRLVGDRKGRQSAAFSWVDWQSNPVASEQKMGMEDEHVEQKTAAQNEED